MYNLNFCFFSFIMTNIIEIFSKLFYSIANSSFWNLLLSFDVSFLLLSTSFFLLFFRIFLSFLLLLLYFYVFLVFRYNRPFKRRTLQSNLWLFLSWIFFKIITILFNNYTKSKKSNQLSSSYCLYASLDFSFFIIVFYSFSCSICYLVLTKS